MLASIHLLKRSHDEALANCYKAVALRPNCPTANSYLAHVLHYCGRPAEAVAKVKEAIRISPVYPAWYVHVLAAAYRDIGDLGQSMAVARDGIRLGPADVESRVILCSDHMLAGQPQQAHAAAREIVVLDPTFSTAKYVASQPYRDEQTLERLAGLLRGAGLPG